MSKEITPTLSIIMPTFNHEKELAVMIDSIINSTYGDWELLAVDDGSDEATIRLLQNYIKNDRRIKLIRRNRLPKGAPTCRNIGIDEARGKYIVFFDSDDYITPICLKNRVHAIEEYKHIDFAIFPSGIYTEEGLICTPNINVYGYPIFKDDIKNFISRRLPFIVWNNIYRTNSIRKHKLYWDEELLSLQDSDYNITAITHGMKYKYIVCEPDYGYRVGASKSISKKICTEEHYNSHLHFIEKTYIKIQNTYGHKYDYSLFWGTVCIYNSVMTGRGIESSFSQSAARIIRAYSPKYYFAFKISVNTGLLLSMFFPDKVARQISMLPFLLSRKRKEREKVRLICRIKYSKTT